MLMRFMNLYLEKYGSPTAKGTYKRGTPKSRPRTNCCRCSDKIQQETAIVIPDDVQIELLEAQPRRRGRVSAGDRVPRQADLHARYSARR